MTRILKVFFLRLYGLNLSRANRNSPDQACSDALMQMAMVIAVPIGAAIGLIAAMIPGIADHVVHPDIPLVISVLLVVLLVVLPIVYWVSKAFGHCRNNPAAARPFMSRRERLKSAITFILFPVIAAIIAGYADHALRTKF